jgi:putative peptide zinc metalloprotease protein
MEPALYTTLYPPEASLIESAWIQRGARADAGQELMRLRSPKLDGEIRLSERRLDFYRLRMARTTTTYEESSDFQIATRQFLAESSRLAGLKRQQERLTIRAPFAGILTDVSESLVPGRWVSPKQQIAILVEPGHALVHGLVAETDVAAIDSGQTGRFVPADLSIAPAEVRVAVVGQTAATHFETPYLASVYDGPIAVRKSPEGKLAPTDTVFAVRLDITENRTPPQIVKGTVLIEAKPRSLAALAFEIAASVLLRESGF